MFEEKTIQKSAENLRKLQEKILGPRNSSIYKVEERKFGNIEQITRIFPCGKMQTKIKILLKK